MLFRSDDGTPCTRDSCWGWDPSSGLGGVAEGKCVNENLCPGGQFCCANGDCCSEPCDECIANGYLSGGVMSVDPDLSCVGDTIVFTLNGVTDTGGRSARTVNSSTSPQ